CSLSFSRVFFFVTCRRLPRSAPFPYTTLFRSRVGLSTTPCWRRIQKLEEDGVITGRVALLDPRKVNTKVTAFVAITTNQHNEERSEEHTSELQSRENLVCRLLLEKKNDKVTST